MKLLSSWLIVVAACSGLASPSFAGAGSTYHVSPFGNNTPPFGDWTTAATNIADAVALAGFEDTVLLGDGTYVPGDSIVLSQPIAFKSAHGPEACIIDGQAINEALKIDGVGVLVEGITLLGNGGGFTLDAHSAAATVRSCVFSGWPYLNLTAGCLIDGCVISNAGSIEADGVLFSGCAFGPEIYAPPDPPFSDHVSFNAMASNMFVDCTFRGQVRFSDSFTPWTEWTLSNVVIDGMLFADNALLRGSASGAGTLVVNGDLIQDMAFNGLYDVVARDTVFTNCSFDGSANLHTSIDPNTNWLYGCTFQQAGINLSPGASESFWVLEQAGVDGMLFIEDCGLQGSFSGAGELHLTSVRVVDSSVSSMPILITKNGVYSNCTFGTSGSPGLTPDVVLAGDPDGTSNALYGCTFLGPVALNPDPVAVTSIWHMVDVSVSNVLQVGPTVLEGGLHGAEGRIYTTQSWVRVAVLSNLAHVVASASRITDSEILNGAGRGAELKDGTLMSHCRVHHNAGGGLVVNNAEVRNCDIWENTASGDHGGGLSVSGGVVSACTIVSNTADVGGGISFDADAGVDNTVCYFNGAGVDDNWHVADGDVTWDHVCSMPPPPGTGNVDSDPLLDFPGHDLLPSSPVINAGSLAAWMTNALDLAGHPRVINGVPDLGAYEFIYSEEDYDGDGISNNVETAQYGTDPTRADSDGDGQSDSEEVVAGSDPVAGSSFFAWAGDSLPGPTEEGFVLTWPSTNNRVYTVTRASDLMGGSTEAVALDLPATPPLNAYTDTTAVADGPYFYSISVKLE